MHSRIVTTITTDIDLDTFTPDHKVSIEAGDELPAQVIYAAVAGACKATLNSLPEGTVTDDDDEGDDK